ncbi:31137_t:CDS:2, partial [Gigaspora margarita]
MTDYRDNVSEDSEDYERVRELIDIDETITSRESSDFPDSFWEEFRRLNISSDRLSRNERELSLSESEPPADTNAGSSIRFELNAANVEVANVTRLVDDSEITETEARIIERRKEANLRTIVEIERSMKVSLCYVLDCTVMKELLSEREDTFEKYLEVAEISAITTYLTIKFNSIAGRKNIPL